MASLEFKNTLLENEIKDIKSELKEVSSKPFLLLLKRLKANQVHFEKSFVFNSWEALESDFISYLLPHWDEINRHHNSHSDREAHETFHRKRAAIRASLSPIEEFCMLILRVREGYSEELLAFFFGINESHVSHLLRQISPLVVKYWVPHYLPKLNETLMRDHTPEWMREEIRSKFPIFCSHGLLFGDNMEFFIEKSLNLNLQWQTWSMKLKTANTLKQFIGCLGDGLIVLAAECHQDKPPSEAS